jgi:hypothetical protein
LVILPEENYENLSALEGDCLDWHLEEVHIDNPFRGKSRESQVLRGRLPSLAYEESLYL